jgi:putative colanic acid biosynthesis acetyltransferase WcaF
VPVANPKTANRNDRNYSYWEMIRRILWTIIYPLFRYSPRPCFAWRRFLLRCFGARIGHQVKFYGSVVITMPWNLSIGDWAAVGEHTLIYNLGQITIGDRAIISQRVHLCAGSHDHTQLELPLPLLKPPISIQDHAWICADAFVGPGVTIGQGAIVGARGVAVKDVEPWTIVGGNPAKFIKRREIAATE